MNQANTPTHTVSAKLLHAALQFAAVSGIRYYLTGVAVSRADNGNGVVVQATNGHMLVMLYDEHGEAPDGPPVIIRADIIKALPKSGDVVVYADKSVASQPSPKRFGSREIDVVQARYNTALIDGKFPDVRTVLPDFNAMQPGLQTACWNAGYLAKALQFIGKMTGNITAAVNVWQHPDGQTAVFANDTRDVMLVVMSMRGSNELTRPSWCGIPWRANPAEGTDPVLHEMARLRELVGNLRADLVKLRETKAAKLLRELADAVQNGEGLHGSELAAARQYLQAADPAKRYPADVESDGGEA